jgi:hypothetical protein
MASSSFTKIVVLEKCHMMLPTSVMAFRLGTTEIILLHEKNVPSICTVLPKSLQKV